MKEKLKRINSFALAVFILIVTMIVPLLILGIYNFMSTDDFSIGHAIREFKSLGEGEINSWFFAAWERTKYLYFTFRGCFTLNFFATFNPAFWGEQYSFIVPILMLSIVGASLFLFGNTILKEYYDVKKTDRMILCSFLFFLVVQTMTSPVEGLYWYASAIAYTFLHYNMFIFFAFFLQYRKRNGISSILLFPILMIYSFLMGGTQYTTGLECVLWIAIYLGLFYKKIRWQDIFIFISLLGGLMTSLLAPGNAMRREGFSRGMSSVKAIIYSFINAVKYGIVWISPMLILIILVMLPTIWIIVKTSEKQYRYNFPAIVTILSFCLYAACFTPTLYGTGSASIERVLNQIQVIYYVLLFINLFYWVGYFQKKIGESNKESAGDFKKLLSIGGKYIKQYQWCVLLLIVAVWILTPNKNTFSSISAIRSLCTGEAVTYQEENMERLKILRDENITVAELEKHTVKPKLLYYCDIDNEQGFYYWINSAMANYYNKDQVILKESE